MFLVTQRRFKSDLDEQARTHARAQAVAPSGIDALLERGNIYALRGERTKAVGDWRGVIRISPNSIAAEAARENLAKNRKQAP